MMQQCAVVLAAALALSSAENSNSNSHAKAWELPVDRRLGSNIHRSECDGVRVKLGHRNAQCVSTKHVPEESIFVIGGGRKYKHECDRDPPQYEEAGRSRFLGGDGKSEDMKRGGGSVFYFEIKNMSRQVQTGNKKGRVDCNRIGGGEYPFNLETLKTKKKGMLISIGRGFMKSKVKIFYKAKQENNQVEEKIQVANEVVEQVGQKINELGFKFLRHVAQLNKNTNAVISPLSIFVSMSMLFIGTTKESASEEELAKVLMPKLLKDDRESFKAVMEHVLQKVATKDCTDEESVCMKIANLLYIVKSAMGSYKKDMSKFFSAKVMKGSDVGQVNQWIENNTLGKIKDMLQTIPNGAHLLIVNAVAFKGKWGTTFDDKSGNMEMNFNGEYVRSMKAKDGVHYAKQGTTTMLKIPFNSNDYDVVIIVPRNLESFMRNNLEANKVKNLLKELDQSRESKSIEMPQFEVKLDTDMIKPFKKVLNVKSPFNENNQLLRMVADKNAKLSMAKHTAIIEVSKTGVEAVAATVMLPVSKSISSKEDLFKVDSPFLFCIRSKIGGMLVFMSAVTKPSTKVRR